jgi:hypothetical protein
MNHFIGRYTVDAKHPKGFLAVFQMIRVLIGSLVSLGKMNEQDLMDAGIYLHYKRE